MLIQWIDAVDSNDADFDEVTEEERKKVLGYGMTKEEFLAMIEGVDPIAKNQLVVARLMQVRLNQTLHPKPARCRYSAGGFHALRRLLPQQARWRCRDSSQADDPAPNDYAAGDVGANERSRRLVLGLDATLQVLRARGHLHELLDIHLRRAGELHLHSGPAHQHL